MATIHKDIPLTTTASAAWDAVRDFHHPHQRLTPTVLTGSERDGDARVVTFADGFVAREVVVAVDDDARRLAYAVVDGPFTHHSASMQIVADDEGGGCRLVWVADLLPDELAPLVAGLMDQGSDDMARTLRG